MPTYRVNFTSSEFASFDEIETHSKTLTIHIPPNEKKLCYDIAKHGSTAFYNDSRFEEKTLNKILGERTIFAIQDKTKLYNDNDNSSYTIYISEN